MWNNIFQIYCSVRATKFLQIKPCKIQIHFAFSSSFLLIHISRHLFCLITSIITKRQYSSQPFQYEVNIFRQKSTKLGLKVYLFSMENPCKRGVSFRCVYYPNELNSLLSTILMQCMQLYSYFLPACPSWVLFLLNI